ncbi:proline racemase family protein [Viridibacillus arvi]|uniref:Proline racemase n=1 Tax=Viridibacillus arvi TaxID=263475 RepID=A0A0M0LAE4_9BACL|nr:proline racemase family protein [Viridibacillus arvi]KOO48060.1 hypothetical protein AMD00_20900 [Viridibacillus arvi]
MKFEKMFSTIDAHVAGEAYRIVFQSPITFAENNIKMNHEKLQSQFENTKNLLLKEPRGHRGMHGCIVLPSVVADFSLLFFTHEGVSNFKYESLIATLTGLLETGNLQQKSSHLYTVETVNGIFELHAEIADGEVIAVTLCHTSDLIVENSQDTPLIVIDAERQYALFEKENKAQEITLENLASLSRWGKGKIRNLVEKGINVTGVILIEQDAEDISQVRSVTFESDGYILRSPGIDSTLAIAKVYQKEVLQNSSVFNSTFKVQKDSSEALYTISTEAFVTGIHQFIFDREDPLENGFILA